MKCCLCNGEIEKKTTPDERIYWDKGNNAMPLAEGKCCDICNQTKVLPARLRVYK